MFSAYWMLYAMVDNSTAVQRVLFYFPCTPLSPLISPSFTMKSGQYQLYTRDLKNPLFQPLGLKRSTRTFRFADFGLKYNKMLSKMVDCLLRKSCTWKNRIPRQQKRRVLVWNQRNGWKVVTEVHIQDAFCGICLCFPLLLFMLLSYYLGKSVTKSPHFKKEKKKRKQARKKREGKKRPGEKNQGKI